MEPKIKEGLNNMNPAAKAAGLGDRIAALEDKPGGGESAASFNTELTARLQALESIIDRDADGVVFKFGKDESGNDIVIKILGSGIGDGDTSEFGDGSLGIQSSSGTMYIAKSRTWQAIQSISIPVEGDQTSEATV